MEGEEGCDVSMVAKVGGCPFPTLTWHKASLARPEEKVAIQYDQHINKLVNQDKCTLLVQQASRQDSAIYSLTASNSLGSVTKDIKLSVFGEKNSTPGLGTSRPDVLTSPPWLFLPSRTTWPPRRTSQVHRGLCREDWPGLESPHRGRWIQDHQLCGGEA